MKSEVTYNLHAFITLLPTKKGGRHSAIYSGYKPSLMFNTVKHYSGELTLKGKAVLNPGESGDVIIRLLPAVTLKRNLKLNDSFTIVEGNKAIGSGIILGELKKNEKELTEHN